MEGHFNIPQSVSTFDITNTQAPEILWLDYGVIRNS